MKALLRTLTLGLVGAAGLLLPAAPAPAATPVRTTFVSFRRPRRHVTLDQKVLTYAKGELNQKVGSGQCWDLVDSAIRAAGADAGGDGSYVFGTPIALTDVIPGDCLQFENVNFKHTDPSGSWSTSSYPHHSAIVASVSGRTLTLLNQNVNGNMTVQYSTINLDDRQAGGTLQAYRPK